MIESKFWDAVSFEDHNTFDGAQTTMGAPLRQETNNPSLAYRRFPPLEARGVGGKLYVPAGFSFLRFRFCSRVRTTDDTPVTSGNLYLGLSFRGNADFPWRYSNQAAAHPEQNRVNWQKWHIDMDVGTLGFMEVFPESFQQFSIVRKADDLLDTALDTQWDLMCLNLEIY